MNISYKWLKDYVDFDMTADEVAAALTSVGLEVDGVEEVQSIRGGLEGLTKEEINGYVRFANKAASITTSRPGAIPAMPTLQEVQEGLANEKPLDA